MCVDFNGGGNCANVNVPLDPLGFSPFEVNSGELCNLLGGCPSSVQIISPALLTCTFSDSNSVIGGLNGDVVGPINAGSGYVSSASPFKLSSSKDPLTIICRRVNLDKGDLNDNLRFLSCNIGGT